MTNYQFTLLSLAVEGALDPEQVPAERAEALRGLVEDGYLDQDSKATDLGHATYRIHIDGE